MSKLVLKSMNIISKLPPNVANITKSWLKISVASLALAGLVSIALIASRTPILQNYIPYSWFFKSAMVVHVDLSVLFWLLSVCAMMFSTVTNQKYHIISKTALYLAKMALILILISPFAGSNQPLMNNYIPVLINLWFFLGLSCFAFAILFQTLICIFSFEKSNSYSYYICSAAIILMVAFVAFILSYLSLKSEMSFSTPFDHLLYFEYLFWSGGHILQFTYIQIMQLAWLMSSHVNLDNKYLKIIFGLNILFTLPTLLSFTKPIFQGEYTLFFTNHMKYFGGLTPFLIVIYLIFNKKKLNSSSIVSILLFGTGGIIGFMISSINVTIPAHYHGSVIGVTISYMGLVYLMMKNFGFKMPSSRSLMLQPILLGIGQLIHIIGLALAGGYGALRKHPGVSGNIKSQLGMGIMAIGGILAVVGGVYFIVNTISVLKEKNWCQKQKN